jgi:hypothetical protein
MMASCAAAAIRRPGGPACAGAPVRAFHRLPRLQLWR